MSTNQDITGLVNAPTFTPHSRHRLARLARRRRWILFTVLLFGLGYFAYSRNRRTVPVLPLAYSYMPSPNYDDRPPYTAISCVVLHSTVEPTTQGTERIFLDPKSKVSAHFVVGKDGQVVQMVPIEKRAWHAGVSDLDGVPSLNDFSVGIEMVNLNDGKDPYPDEQVQAVAGIIRFLRAHYTIPDSRIVSHAEIARPAGRKSDPLGFDFDRIRRLSRDIPDEIAPSTTLKSTHR